MHENTGKPPLFVSVGSLTENKNTDSLIRAFKLVLDRYPQAVLKIYGSGPLKEELNKTISDQKLKQHVFLEGVVTRRELADIYREADCFVLVSHSETFGVSYIEAMAAGLPVIAGMSGGPEEFINKENGMMVPENDIHQIADAMCRIYEHADEYDRELISRKTAEKYCGEAVADQLVDIYTDLIS